MDCDGCKWWSELIARSTEGRPMEAMCLNCESRYYNRLVSLGCELHAPGRAIDDPAFAYGDPFRSDEDE
jgi:hypothetical protein